MPKISIDIIDTTGNVTQLPLPNDKPVREIVSSVITLTDLTEQDALGKTINYRFFSRRTLQILKDELSLDANGVQEGDQLRATPAPRNTELQFVLLSDPEPGAILSLPNTPKITIGRGSSNDIVIRDAIVSRHHGELIYQSGVHIYRDLNSANGSFINNNLVSEPMPLAIGSILSFGESVRLRYQEVPIISSEDAEEIGELNANKHNTGLRTSLTPLPRAGVFMSYSKNEEDLVKPVVEALRRVNFHVFWAEEIPTGSNVEETITSNLDATNVMIAFITPLSEVNSKLIAQWNRFILNRKPIVVVQYNETDIPAELTGAQVISFRGSNTRLMQELVAKVIEEVR